MSDENDTLSVYAMGYSMSAITSVQLRETADYCAPRNLPITVSMLEKTAESFIEAHPEIDRTKVPMEFWLPKWFEWMFPCD